MNSIIINNNNNYGLFQLSGGHNHPHFKLYCLWIKTREGNPDSFYWVDVNSGKGVSLFRESSTSIASCAYYKSSVLIWKIFL